MLKTASDIYPREISYELPSGVPARYYVAGTPLFTAYGCALLERRTSKSYVYSAVNLKSGKCETLCRRTLPLEERAHAGIAAKIRMSSVAGSGRLNTDKDPSETLPRKELAAILSQIFTDVLPRYGYAVRENQISLAEHILDTISHRAVSLAESEVGTGKTHAYLISAVLARRGRLNDFWLRGHYHTQSYAESAYMPIVVATSSIALQRAIVRDYIPELSDILMEHGVIRTPLTCAIRKGKEHYICEKRLRVFCADADDRTKTLLRPLMAPDASCDLADTEGLTSFMKRKVCVSGRCGENCRHFTGCRYIQYLSKANDPKIDFQITNHHYFLADVLHRADGKRPLLPHYQLVIIDEAHKFLQAARQMYSISLSDTELLFLAETIHSFTEGKSVDGINVHRLAKKLETQGVKLFQRLIGNIPDNRDDETERFPAVIDTEASRHLKNIAGIAADLVFALADSHTPVRFLERKAQTVWELENLERRAASLRKHDDLICCLETSGEGEDGETVLRAIPKDLDARLHRDIWSSGIPIILTSGTLSASGDFTRPRQTLGMCHMPAQKLFNASMPSPFDYKNNALLYISENTPFPDDKDKRYIISVADEIERLVIASHGHAAVLFTSYNAMGQVHAILKSRRLPFPLFRLECGGTHAIEQFKKSGNGVLLASGALWEGIDIPGDMLSMLIIVKLPFAVPDPIGDYEKSLCGDMEEYKAKALVPDMLVKLKQGFGRLIRSETDTGAVAILDSRANRFGAYRRWVLPALPPCRVTSDIYRVEGFIREKKPADYFTDHSKGGRV